MYTDTTHITLSYRCTPRTEVAYTNYLAGSLNIYTGKTLVFNFGTLSSHPSINGKLYYNSSLFLNKNIDLTSISL